MSVYGMGKKISKGHFIVTLRHLLSMTVCPSKLAFSEPQSRLVVSHVLRRSTDEQIGESHTIETKINERYDMAHQVGSSEICFVGCT